jgi:hypothetical protein
MPDPLLEHVLNIDAFISELAAKFTHISIVKSPVPNANAELLGTVKQSPVPSKYALP